MKLQIFGFQEKLGLPPAHSACRSLMTRKPSNLDLNSCFCFAKITIGDVYDILHAPKQPRWRCCETNKWGSDVANDETFVIFLDLRQWVP